LTTRFRYETIQQNLEKIIARLNAKVLTVNVSQATDKTQPSDRSCGDQSGGGVERERGGYKSNMRSLLTGSSLLKVI